MRGVIRLTVLLGLAASPSLAQIPVPVVLEGSPALRYAAVGGPSRSQGGITYVTRVMRNEQPALRFELFHGHGMSCGGCAGYLYIMGDRIVFEPVFTPKDQGDAFDISRTDVREAKKAGRMGHYIELKLAKRTMRFCVALDRDGKKIDTIFTPSEPIVEFFGRSISDFAGAMREFDQMTASLKAPGARLAVAELKEGQTIEEVVRLLGEPGEKISVGNSVVYLYPRYKLIFESGKLVSKQPR